MQSQVEFSAHAEAGAELVRSPVTDRPCIYWRLRIVERLTAGSQLVHEMASSQAFHLLWGARNGATAPVRILVEPDNTRIEGTPALHRHGSAGALARGLTLADLEREYIERVLAAEGGNKTRAAQRLGLDRKTLYRKLEEYARVAGTVVSEPDEG